MIYNRYINVNIFLYIFAFLYFDEVVNYNYIIYTYIIIKN